MKRAGRVRGPGGDIFRNRKNKFHFTILAISHSAVGTKESPGTRKGLRSETHR